MALTENDDMTSLSTHKTVRLTTAQAVVKYLAAQYSVADGDRRRLIPAALGIGGVGAGGIGAGALVIPAGSDGSFE